MLPTYSSSDCPFVEWLPVGSCSWLHPVATGMTASTLVIMFSTSTVLPSVFSASCSLLMWVVAFLDHLRDVYILPILRLPIHRAVAGLMYDDICFAKGCHRGLLHILFAMLDLLLSLMSCISSSSPTSSAGYMSHSNGQTTFPSVA